MHSAADKMVECSKSMTSQAELIKLKQDNIKLIQKVHILEKEQDRLKEKLLENENHSLESCLISKGITDEKWEKELVMIDKVYHAIVRMVVTENNTERQKSVQNMAIKCYKLLGRFNEKKTHFCGASSKKGCRLCVQNKSYLNTGIFVDQEYNDEVE